MDRNLVHHARAGHRSPAFSGRRVPALINKRLHGYTPGHQQFDYPIHNIRVASGPKTLTLAPGTQQGLFSNVSGVGRLDPHTYRRSNSSATTGSTMASSNMAPEVTSFLLLRYLGMSRIEPEVAKYTPSTYVRTSRSMMARPGTAMLQSLILTMC